MMVGTIDLMRKATLEDAAPISLLELKLFPENCMNETTLANEIEDPTTTCWVQYEGDELAGYILIRKDGGLLDILRLGVHPNFQKIGIGRRLLDAVLQANDPTILTVQKDNEVAFKFYYRHGFRIVGHLSSDAGWIMKRSAN